MNKGMIILLCIFCLTSGVSAQEELKINNKDIANIENIMIVAHPDDETIWGGGHLLKEKYFVVCLTNGDNRIRNQEFNNVLKASHAKGIILNYPDKTNGKKDNWKKVKSQIIFDLKKILTLKKWKKIVTHNPQGEYGHIHHKMTSNIVTKICRKEKNLNSLLYFGKYYSKKRIKHIGNKGKLKVKDEKQKQEILELYISQGKAKALFKQMFPYENFIPYHNWK